MRQTLRIRLKTLLNKGNKKAEQTSQGVQNLSDDMGNISTVVDELDQNVSNISNILDVIKSIADQTNLLALNAAIEAARAGEQGRGFAVVADEVRTLAQNTQNSTTEIEEVITKLQQSTKASVQAMASGRKNATTIVEQTLEMKGVFEEINDSVNDITDMTSQIATAAEEQNVVASDVGGRSVEIREITKETGDSSQQIMSSTEELAQLAIDLTEQVNQFKI